MLSRMIYKIVCTDTRPLESVVAVQSMLWGIWLLLPFQTFNSSSVFQVMRLVAPEDVWGFFSVVVGVVLLVVMHLNNRKWRKRVVTLALFLWLFVDVTFWLTLSLSTASVTNLIFVLMSMWSLIALSMPDGNCA